MLEKLGGNVLPSNSTRNLKIVKDDLRNLNMVTSSSESVLP